MVDLNTRTGEMTNLTVMEGDSGSQQDKRICIVIRNPELQDNLVLKVLSGSTATSEFPIRCIEVILLKHCMVIL